MTKEKMQEISFQIIGLAGTAKACYMEAIDLAKKGDFAQAKIEIKNGNDALAQTHKQHFEVISCECRDEEVPLSCLFLHSEDQFLTTDLLGSLAEKMVEMYEVIHGQVKY